MRFENSNLLWLLLVVPPAMAFFFWWIGRVKEKLLAQFVEARLLAQLTTGISPARQKLRFTFLILAVACLIFTLARLQAGFELEEVQQRGLDIVVAVDTSKSMLATDIAPNRLARAKLAALELMQRAATDRIGLVAFAGDAFLACPLTIDNTAFQQSVQALDVKTIPQGGTALAAAIETAQTAFKEKGHHRVLVLLTDGEDNDEGALAAAESAAKAGLKIFTIGIGTAAGEILRATDANGNSDYVRDEQGNVVKSHLNEALLQQIATTAGGFYLPLRGADALDTLYDRGLAPLPKSSGSEKLLRRYHEQFHWSLAAAMLLLLAEIFLPERSWRTSNKSTVNPPSSDSGATRSPKSKVPVSAVTVLAVTLLLPVCSKASPATALHDYKAGNFTNALAEFQRLAEVQTNDLRLAFNAGAAAYRATNFDEAAKLFSAVTLSPDLKLQQQAFYNLGNTQFQSAKQAKDLDGLEQGFEAAAKLYERAVILNTNDVDAVFNLNFTKNAIEQIKQFREAMRRAKGDADAAVRQRNYHRAVEIMEGLAKFQIAAKQFEEFTKKLKDIDAIATPHQP